MRDRKLLRRLREAREARAMSLDDLARHSGVSRSLLAAYEKGTHEPRPETVVKLSAALDVLPSFFFSEPPAPEPAPVFMRHFRSKAGAKQMGAVHRQLLWARHVLSVLEEYVVFPDVNFPDFGPPSDPRDITFEQIEQAASALRRHWGLGDGVINHVIRLVENNGCVVIPEVVRCDHIDAFSQWSNKGSPVIVVNAAHSTGVRWRVDIAHELGHLVMHRMVDRRFLEVNPSTHALIEQQAFRFAGAFLMPAQSFRASLPHISLDDLLLAKPLWLVSVQAMLYRAEDLGMIDAPTGKRLWQNLTRRGWKKREPLDETMLVERPQLLARAIAAIVADDPLHIEEISAMTGLRQADIARYCSVAESDLRGPDLALPFIREKRDLEMA